MAFVDKIKNELTSAPARYLLIETGFFLEIQTGFRFIIQAATEASNWTDKSRTPS